MRQIDRLFLRCDERTCLFCNKGVVEIEWHFISKCATYKDIHKHEDNGV